jgi:predicted metal-dependent enzyme (double-stranded beta helix superfamily)
MKNFTSHASLKLLSLTAAALLAAAPLSYAQSTAQTPPAPPAQGMHHMPTQQQMAAHAQKRLDKLERSLNLQPGQQAAWGSYKNSALADMNERGAKMQQHREQMQRDQASGAAAVPAPQRMEAHAKRMHEHADALSRKAQQVQSLYAALTPEQRTIFDLQQQKHAHKHSAWGMQHGRG